MNQSIHPSMSIVHSSGVLKVLGLIDLIGFPYEGPMSMLLLLLLLDLSLVSANNNGLALTPPMGWRSWNLYKDRVDQNLIQSVMKGMVSRKRTVDGVPTSLCDLGYCNVGLDDAWQLCGKHGSKGFHYHDDQGNPIINTTRFPNLKAMTDYAHSLNLTAGFYGNNCICRETLPEASAMEFYQNDIRAFLEFNFDSWKLDGCGPQLDLQLWDDLLRNTTYTSSDGITKKTGKAVVVENCHWGHVEPFQPTQSWCPWNMYRTSYDVRNNYGSVMDNLNNHSLYAKANLSYPGCWAYPDMLEVGCAADQATYKGDVGLTTAETRSHFGSWAIVSSPLVLSHDVNNDIIMDEIWPIIANTEVIAVNQAYYGHSGSAFQYSENDNVTILVPDRFHHGVDGDISTSRWQYLYKPLSWHGSQVAVLLMNSDVQALDLSLQFQGIPGLLCSNRCQVRDIWNRKNLGTFRRSYTAHDVASHDAVFLIISTPLHDSAWSYHLPQKGFLTGMFFFVTLVILCPPTILFCWRQREKRDQQYTPVDQSLEMSPHVG
jgi:alpha-galactosidase